MIEQTYHNINYINKYCKRNFFSCIIAKTNITKVNVYTITGAFVKSIEVSDFDNYYALR